MIADAVDAALTIGWALFAWLFAAAFVALFLLLSVCGVVWMLPVAACRGVAGAVAASRALRAWQDAPSLPRPPEGLLGASSAQVSRTDLAATGPSRPHGPRQGATQGVGGGFHAPHPTRPAQRRSAPSWARTQPITKEN